MTDNTNPQTPKKSKKKLLVILSAAIVLILGVNHFTFKVGYAEVEVKVTDSTIITTITPEVSPEPAPVDTVKEDTTKK